MHALKTSNTQRANQLLKLGTATRSKRTWFTDVAKLLVNYGLNPSQKTDKNWTPLHEAARYGLWQLAQYYFSVGVGPDIRNSDGKTALGLAQHLRHQSIIKLLSPVTTRSSLNFSRLNSPRKVTKKKSKKNRKSKQKK